MAQIISPLDDQLMVAIVNNRNAEILDALKKGANSSLKFGGMPVVMNELIVDHYNVARAMFEHGSDPNATIDIKGQVPIPMVHYFVNQGDKYLKALEMLQEFGADFGVLHLSRTALCTALMKNGYRAAALCAKVGQNVDQIMNIQNEIRITALGMMTHSAGSDASQDQRLSAEAKAVYLVKELKADRSVPGINDILPAEIARQVGHADLAKWLDPATPLGQLPDYRTLPGYKKPIARALTRAPSGKGPQYH